MSETENGRELTDLIQSELSEPAQLLAERLSDPVCDGCGEPLLRDARENPTHAEYLQLTTWDIPERDNKRWVHRYHYCSPECRDRAKYRVCTDSQEMHRAEPVVLSPEEREVLSGAA